MTRRARPGRTPPGGADAERQVDRYLATLERLLAIDAGTVPEALEAAAQLVAEALGADTVDAFLHDSASDRLVALGVSGTPLGRRQRALGLDRLPLAASGRAGEVYRTGIPYRTGRADRDAAELPALVARLGVRSTLAVPLAIAGARRGVLVATAARPEAFAAADLRFLTTVARWVGMVAHRAEAEELRAQARHLAHRALHDALTGLPNRALLLDRLAAALASSRGPARPVVVLFLDLDDLQGVNERLGHAAGDQLLVAVAERLRGCVRPEDTVARLGGDEFVVLLTAAHAAAQPERIAARLLAAFAVPFAVAGREVAVTASVGIAGGLAGRDRAEALLGAADAAQHRAKAAGGARYLVAGPTEPPDAAAPPRAEAEPGWA